jgi:hypothetical protein
MNYTADQLKQMYGGQLGQGTSTPAAPAPKPSLFGGIKSDFNTRVGAAADAQQSSIAGQQSNVSGALQTIGQGAGFVGDVAARGLSAVTPDFIEDPLKKGVQALGQTQTAQEAAAKYSTWKSANPELAANLEAVVNISSLLPIGTGATTVAQQGTRAALVGGGKAIEGAADAISVPGKAVSSVGGGVYRSAIAPTVPEAERILEYRANTPFLTRVTNDPGKQPGAPVTRAQTALERGIMGTESAIGVQSKRIADDLWNKEIKPAVARSKATVSKEELFAPALARINATTDPTKRAALQAALDALTEDYAKFPDTIDLAKAQALKRDLDEFTPAKVFKGQDVASEVRMLQHDMADAIRQKTYTSLADDNIRRKYLDWANLHELQKVGVKAISEAKFKGGSGTLIGGLWDAATVPIRTISGQVLYRVGNALEFTAPQGIKTFGQFLQQKGFQKPTQYELPKASMGLSVQSNAGKANRLVSWTENGKKHSVALEPDAVRGFTESLDRKGVDYSITTKSSRGQ